MFALITLSDWGRRRRVSIDLNMIEVDTWWRLLLDDSHEGSFDLVQVLGGLQ